jgi:amidase
MTPSMNDELVGRTIRELSGMLRRREVSAVELTRAHLDRIDAVNPEVNAFVTVDAERALREAAAADEGLMAGAAIGPLHGIPAGFKDTHDTAGMRTTYGSPLFADHVPSADDLVVRRIREAGAITLGKTNVPEFAAGANSFNPVFGATRNPHDHGRTAGGSTGGSAAALASGMATACEGSDFGGSLRTPASFCGVVGLRPSPGRVPDVPGQFGWQSLAVQGPMGRTVDDAAIMLSVIAGYDARNPIALEQDPAVFADIAPADLRGLRVAWTPDLGGRVDVEPEVLDVLARRVRALESLGCVVEEACPDLDGAAPAFRTLRAWMFAHSFDDAYRLHPDQLKPSLIGNIEQGLHLTGRDIAAAIDTHTRVHLAAAEFFTRYDLLALPAAPTLPFPVEQEYPPSIAGRPSGDYLDYLMLAGHITMTGCPAICVPAGLSPGGLPVGLQLVAAHRADAALLAMARACEQL